MPPLRWGVFCRVMRDIIGALGLEYSVMATVYGVEFYRNYIPK